MSNTKGARSAEAVKLPASQNKDESTEKVSTENGVRLPVSRVGLTGEDFTYKVTYDGLWGIFLKAGGNVPSRLSGHYTHLHLAEEAVGDYVESQVGE